MNQKLGRSLQHLNLRDLDPLFFVGLKHLLYLDLSENNFESIPTGLFAQTDKLRSLNLRSNNLTSIPKEVGQLKELRRVDLSNNKIEIITAEELSSLAGVGNVNLRNNNILRVTGTYVSRSTKRVLKTLDLSGNLIESLQPNTFVAFPTLANLDLSSNNISLIHMDAFNGLSNLKNLFLKQNQLQQIESLTFRPLVSLTTLDLSHSLISSFGDGAFLDVHNLKMLNLTHNQIESIGGWLFGLNSILKLDLSYNNIEHLDEGEAAMWTLAKTLEWISLAHNRISYIPKTFQVLKNLKYLFLGNNLINGIAPDAFHELQQLSFLDLSGNLLNEFLEYGEGFKNSQISIKELIIAWNGISAISANMFTNLNNLRLLDLSYNPISVMRDNAFDTLHLQKLQVVINTSSMICDCNLKWFRNWFKSSNLSQSDVSIVCAYPQKYSGANIFDLDISDLICDTLPQPRVLNHSQVSVKGVFGDLSKLTCNVTGSAPMDIEWNVYRDGHKKSVTQSVENFYAEVDGFDEENAKHYVYSELIFKNISFEDEGEYRCSAKNSYGAVHTPRHEFWKIKFTVVQEPKLTVLPENVTVKIGSTAKFRCAAQGKPAPTLKWKKEGGTMFAAEEKRLHVKSDEDSFYIMDVKKADAGLYKCVAENSNGRSEASAVLTVCGIF